MKRLLIIFLAVLICVPSVFGRRKSKKSGEIDNNVYTDTEYEFKLTLLENWDTELQKPDKEIRLIMNQKDYQIPPDLMPYPTMTKVPELIIMVAEIPFSPPAFVDSVASNTYKSDAKKELLKDMVALEENVSFEGLRKTAKKSIEIDSMEAVQWEGIADYIKDLGMGETIPRTYAVGMIAVKRDKYTIVFMLECERTFFADIFGEVITMAESLKW